MSIINTLYSEKEHLDESWYSSSNIIYSKFQEDAETNKGTLTVVFKNGATYEYYDVDMPHDYLMFKHGGLDGSNGKALNSFIKPKYEYSRVEDTNLELLEEKRKKIEENENKKDGNV